MRKPLSLKHKVQIPNGRLIDLQHTDVRATFARARAEAAAEAQRLAALADAARAQAEAEERERTEKVRKLRKN